MKAEGYDGRFDLELTGFFVNFNNRPISIAVDGQPALADGGKERFRGVELESRFRFDPHVALSLNYTHGSAVYVDSTTVIGSTQVSLAGNRIELVPRDQAQAAVVFGTRNGWYGSLAATFLGQRFLDAQNQFTTPGYLSADASLGYGFKDLAIGLSVANIGDRREPLVASELGDSQIYRQVGRRIFLKLTYRLP